MNICDTQHEGNGGHKSRSFDLEASSLKQYRIGLVLSRQTYFPFVVPSFIISKLQAFN